MEEIQQTRIRCARKDSSVYPARLKELPGMPKQLYYIGSFPDDAKPTAAIVGARLCSPYGRIQAFNYGKFLSEHGVQVISGMAAGIDAEGHKGALEGGTPTFAVLGNGVDICYPSSSRGIYRRIPEKNGGIISEYEPGTKGRAYYFSGKEPDHQRTGRSGACGGSKRKERITDHSCLCTGTGEDGIRHSGSGK